MSHEDGREGDVGASLDVRTIEAMDGLNKKEGNSVEKK